MAFKIRHGLIECTNYPNTKKSAIIFDDEFIITSGFLLYPHFRENSPTEGSSRDDNLVELLRKHKIINGDNEPLKSLDFEITYDQQRVQSKTKYLLRFKARIVCMFNCRDILTSAENILKGFSEYSERDESASYENLHKLMLSSFIILQLVDPDREPGHFKSFVAQMKNYIKFIDSVNKLDDVLTISTPFGMESFYKTINIGKISNVFGIDSCLFAISNNLVNGCEGSAVINSRLHLIGVIISTTFRWNNENANFTLAANFRHVLKEFFRQIQERFSDGNVSRDLAMPAWENAVVLLSYGGSWGTGSLVKIRKAKFILTCSHIIKGSQQKIFCHYADGSFETNLLWKNPHYNRPYDIAIVEIPVSIPDHYFLRISRSTPHVGQEIYSAGFPLLSKLGKEVFRPSLYGGRIIKFSPGMIISDASIQAGQSGGPLIDASGRLLGVSVANSRDHETKLIYPNINMSVPINDIKTELETFAKTKDICVLNNLIAGVEVQESWDLKGPLVKCKL